MTLIGEGNGWTCKKDIKKYRVYGSKYAFLFAEKVSISSKTPPPPGSSPREQSECGFDKWMYVPRLAVASLIAIVSSVIGEDIRITGRNF